MPLSMPGRHHCFVELRPIENAFLHIPRGGALASPKYLHEMDGFFPKGKHDDQADSTAQFSSTAFQYPLACWGNIRGHPGEKP